jgi:hypothetical protein
VEKIGLIGCGMNWKEDHRSRREKVAFAGTQLGADLVAKSGKGKEPMPVIPKKSSDAAARRQWIGDWRCGMTVASPRAEHRRCGKRVDEWEKQGFAAVMALERPKRQSRRGESRRCVARRVKKRAKR